MTWRVIAQRVLTGEFVHWDVPMIETTASRELSGPGGITGTINPELRQKIAHDGLPVLDEWTTALYVEEDNIIRAGGLLQNLEWQGQVMSVDAPGFSSYASGQPIVKNYTPAAYEDPVRVFRNIWNYVQSFPNSDIGLRVRAPQTYMKLSDGEGPYNIKYYEYRDAGQELENIATVCPFDFAEKHTWTGADRTRIHHELTVGFPRLGVAQADMRLVQGENVVQVSTVALDGSRFANQVYVLGNGTDAAMKVGTATRTDGRLRRAVVVPRRADSEGVANAYAKTELRARDLQYDISEVVIRDHENARISAINPGDDISCEVDLPHIGNITMSLRVLSIEQSSATPSRATLKTMRSSFFVYAPRTSPTGNYVIVTM